MSQPVLDVRGETLALFGPAFTTPAGDVETVLLIHRLNSQGRIDATAIFDIEDRGAAIAELDALWAEEQTRSGSLAPGRQLATAVLGLTNQCVRTRQRFSDAVRRGDDDVAGDLLAEDHVDEDRRATVNVGTVVGADAWLENVRHVFGGLTDASATVLAIRGETLALSRVAFEYPTGELAALTISQIDADGRLCRNVAFDTGDLIAATEELDRLYLEEIGRTDHEALAQVVENWRGRAFGRGADDRDVGPGLLVRRAPVAQLARGAGP